MSYADQKMSGSRIGAIIIVALIHVALGYAFVTGLALKYVKKAAEQLNTFDVEEPPPPPPDEPPPPPPDIKLEPPPVVAPPPIVRNPNPPAVVISTVRTPPPVFIPTPRAVPPPPPPAPPPPPKISQAAGLRGNPGQFFGPDAYPASAQRAGESGRVVAKLTVGIDGRVTDCTVTTSSGSSALDSATCRIARSRVRYTPAKDQDGRPIQSNATIPVQWVLPDDR